MNKSNQICGLKDCDKVIGPGAADVTFDNEGRDAIVRVCSEHAFMLMSAPRGTWRITPKRELKPVPAAPIHFI